MDLLSMDINGAICVIFRPNIVMSMDLIVVSVVISNDEILLVYYNQYRIYDISF